MDNNIKEKWVAALRSGNYTQDRDNGQLRTTIKDTVCHCVLGVLAEEQGLTIDELGWALIVNDEDMGYSPLVDIIGDEDQLDKLWHLNDTKKLTFEELAVYIEENL